VKDTDRLVAEMEDRPTYRGWSFSYEYPGFFCYSSKESPYRVFCTPDWEKLGTLDIQVQTDDGHDVPDWGDILPLPGKGRTGQKIFEMVRPTLDRLSGVVSAP
jgi:hypothetical protein